MPRSGYRRRLKRGVGAEELVQNLSRARTLCQVLNDDATLVIVLVGLGRSYDPRADHKAIEELTKEELGLLDRVQEPTLALQLHTHLGTSYIFRGMGARYMLPLYLPFATDAYRRLGRIEEGIATMAEAIDLTETYADVCWIAEVYRCRGELFLTDTGRDSQRSGAGQSAGRRVGRSQARSPRDTSTAANLRLAVSHTQARAEECLQKALDIARQQEVKSLELRAAHALLAELV